MCPASRIAALAALGIASAAAALAGCGSTCSTRVLDVPVVTAAGDSAMTACAAIDGGRVHCWFQKRTFWVPELDDAVSLSATDTQGCAVRRHGTVMCWRFSWDLGNERVYTWSIPLDAPTRIVTMTHGACALVSAGRVTCWMTDVRVDDAMKPAPVPNLDDVVDIAANLDSVIALRRGGDVVSFEMSAPPTESRVIKKIPEATQVVIGDHAMCALTRAGEVECWGDNWMGVLGNGGLEPQSTPSPVQGLSGVVQIAAGRSHVCARHADGFVSCWGSNQYGQIGVGSTGLSDARRRPVRIPDLRVESLRGGSCALTASHALMCWGWGDDGIDRMRVCAAKGQ
jgi:hypothetical protein